MSDLCRLLSDHLERKAVDRTGIPGTFDLHLDLSAADLGHRNPGEPEDPGRAESAIRAALGKFGLRLVAAKGTDESLVVLVAVRPSEN